MAMYSTWYGRGGKTHAKAASVGTLCLQHWCAACTSMLEGARHTVWRLWLSHRSCRLVPFGRCFWQRKREGWAKTTAATPRPTLNGSRRHRNRRKRRHHAPNPEHEHQASSRHRVKGEIQESGVHVQQVIPPLCTKSTCGTTVLCTPF